MLKKFKEIKETYRETKKSTIMVYVILRALVIISMIRQIILGEISNAALCLLSYFLIALRKALLKPSTTSAIP